MNDTLASKLASFRATLDVADESEFKPVWQTKPPAAFEEGLAAARATVRELASKGADQSAPTIGATDSLRQIRGDFEKALLPRARAIFRCLQALGRAEDAAKADLTPSDLHNARAVNLAGLGETILDLAEPLTAGQPAPGAKYGITAESIAALDAAWDRYSTTVGAPAGARARRKALTEQLPAAFRAAEEEFATLDDLILQFDDAGGPGTHFIDSWFNARRVQDTGRRSARPAPPPAGAPPTPPPPPAPKP
jgi:hypothetical protein